MMLICSGWGSHAGAVKPLGGLPRKSVRTWFDLHMTSRNCLVVKSPGYLALSEEIVARTAGEGTYS